MSLCTLALMILDYKSNALLMQAGTCLGLLWPHETIIDNKDAFLHL